MNDDSTRKLKLLRHMRRTMGGRHFAAPSVVDDLTDLAYNPAPTVADVLDVMHRLKSARDPMCDRGLHHISWAVVKARQDATGDPYPQPPLIRVAAGKWIACIEATDEQFEAFIVWTRDRVREDFDLFRLWTDEVAEITDAHGRAELTGHLLWTKCLFDMADRLEDAVTLAVTT